MEKYDLNTDTLLFKSALEALLIQRKAKEKAVPKGYKFDNEHWDEHNARIENLIKDLIHTKYIEIKSYK